MRTGANSLFLFLRCRKGGRLLGLLGHVWPARGCPLMGGEADESGVASKGRLLTHSGHKPVEIPQRGNAEVCYPFGRRRRPRPPRFRTPGLPRGDPMKRRQFITLVGGTVI